MSKYRKNCLIIAIICLMLWAVGCVSLHPSFYTWKEGDPKPAYHDLIRDWQERIQREGWSERLVGEVCYTVRWLIDYKLDMNDDIWSMPDEALRSGTGDCEDIATLQYWTLKRVLGYSHQVRLAVYDCQHMQIWLHLTTFPFPIPPSVIRSTDWDHAVLHVEMPDGIWKLYDSTGALGMVPAPRLMVEWDENNIYTVEVIGG